MTYTVQQLATLAGISVRTLHYYDEIGLLKPSFVGENGYRQYEEKEILKLQQILFFRELEFPLEQILEIVSASGFDATKALKEQKKLLELKRKRIDGLLTAIATTIEKSEKGEPMTTDDVFGPFADLAYNQYKDEAKSRWGHTDAYKQSMERLKKMSASDWQQIKQESGEIIQGLADNMDKGIDDSVVQELIGRYHQHMNRFYDCSVEMFRGLGQMYVDDARFTAFYEKVRPGLAVFVRDAIAVYCDKKAEL